MMWREKYKRIARCISSVMLGILLTSCGESVDDKQPSAAVTDESIFVEDKLQKVRDITEVIIALPSSDLHDKPSQYYDRLVAEINEYTGMNVTWKWYKPVDYYKQLEEDILTGNLADVVLIDRSDLFFDAMDEGMFWEVGPYMDEYDNLAVIPEGSRISASYNGKIYGIPCSGGKITVGLGYRADWLEKLGLEEPKDWESFCKMLEAFTYQDPDGNGVDDTIGLLLDAQARWWDVMECWFGVPNVWGDENGNLVHKTQTKEYRNAYKTFRELYAQGVINCGENGFADFRELTQSEDLIKAKQDSHWGCMVDSLVNFMSVQEYFVKQGVASEDELLIQLLASVDTGFGNKCHLEFGGGEMLVISKGGVREEAHFKRILQFLNDINDGACEELIAYGWENETYTINEEGIADFYIMNESKDATIFTYRIGFSSVGTGFVAEANRGSILTVVDTNPMAIMRKQLIQDNIANGVVNYGYPIMNGAEAEILERLDGMLWEAEMQYITGELDDAGFEAVLKKWLEDGGEELTNALNEKYQRIGK